MGLSARLALIGWACSSALHARVLAQCSASMSDRCVRCSPANELPPAPAPLCLLAGLGAIKPLPGPLLVPVAVPVLE